MPLNQALFAVSSFGHDTFQPLPSCFQGSSSLPPRGKMWEDIIAKEDAMRARYVQTQRHTIQVDWLPYLDELAEQVGCKPNLSESIGLFRTGLEP